MNVKGDLEITDGGLRVDNDGVLDVAGSTTIKTDGRLIFEETRGIANLDTLYMTGGSLGTKKGKVNCSSLTITGGPNEISDVDLTVDGSATVEASGVFESANQRCRF